MIPRTLLLSACSLLGLSAALAGTGSAFYGDPPDATHPWTVHDPHRPVPAIVKAGELPGQPPSDAVVLFDGSSLNAWESSSKLGLPLPAAWEIVDGALQVVPKTGPLRTKNSFGDCQLHIEWATPTEVAGSSQGRGNSGVFLMGRYEVQVLDSYQNESYADGQAASVYGQNPPLVNVARPPGAWQSYDIVFHAPRFGAKGEVSIPGTVTVFHNGVLVQDHWIFEGIPGHKARAKFTPHGPTGPIELQDHGNRGRFRNIWIREIPPKHTVTREEAAAQRQQTAARLRKEASAKTVRLERLLGLMESLVYVPDAAALAEAKILAAAQLKELQSLDRPALEARVEELKQLHAAFKYMETHRLTPEGAFATDEPAALLKKAGVTL